MKYNIGDKIKIKPIYWYDINKDIYGFVIKDNVAFRPTMSKYCGMLATIINIEFLNDLPYYILDIDNGTWGWWNWMFE